MAFDPCPKTAALESAGAAALACEADVRAGAALHRALALPDEVHLHCVLDAVPDPLARWAARLPPALAGACAKRQREFLLGRVCAAAALHRAGCAGEPWIAAGEDKLPRWPAGWIGSISHAGAGAIAAVARAAPGALLGIDMERAIEASIADEIRDQVAQPQELALFDDLGAAQALTVLFSAKEALYKALYPEVRTFFDFSAARAVRCEPQRLWLRLELPWSARWPAGSRVEVCYAIDRGYVFTAVSRLAPSP